MTTVGGDEGPDETSRPRIGVLGRIAAGEYAGWFVEVVDDAAATGGFLILVHDAADRSGAGYDSWVGSIGDVEQYFSESGRVVEWPG